MADGSAVDTSVLVAAHVAGHEHRDLAAPAAAGASHVIGPVLAETWSVLRRHFRLPAVDVAAALQRYLANRTLVAPTPGTYAAVAEDGPAMGLGGNVHDFVIVDTARRSGLRLATFDRGMQRLATAIVDPLV